MAAMNAWGFLANMDRLSPDVLSFLSGVVSELQAAITARIETVTIANAKFDLPYYPDLLDGKARPFALMFAASCAGQHQGQRLGSAQLSDEFLATHCRRIVLMAPPVSLLLEAALRFARKLFA